MKKIKEQELQLLTKICRQHNLPFKMVHDLKRSAEKYSYENMSPAARRKEYNDLIEYYSKNPKGE